MEKEFKEFTIRLLIRGNKMYYKRKIGTKSSVIMSRKEAEDLADYFWEKHKKGEDISDVV